MVSLSVMSPRGRVATRFAPLVGPIDQGLSSLTNFIPAVLVARRSSVDDFADISLALLAVGLGLGLIRSFVGEVSLAEASTGSTAELASDDHSSTGAAVLLAVGCSVVMLAVALIIGGGPITDHPLALAAFALPFVTYQDHLRYVSFARSRGLVACVSDGLWLAVLAVAVLVLPQDTEWVTVFVVWALASAAGSVASVVMLRVFARVRHAGGWIRGTMGRGGRFALEYVSTFGASSLALMLIGAIREEGDLAAVRGLQLMASPALILLGGFGMTLPAALAHRLGAAELLRTMRTFSVRLAAVGAVACVPLVMLPRRVGTWLLGDTWSLVSGIRWLAIPYVVFGAITAIFKVGVRASRAESRSSRYQLFLVPVVMLAPPVAAAIGGPLTCMLSVVVGTGVTAGAWYLAARRGPRTTLAAVRDGAPVGPLPMPSSGTSTGSGSTPAAPS